MTLRRLVIAAACALMIAPLAAFLMWKPRLLDDVTFSRAVFDRNGQLLRLTLARDQSYRLFTPLKDISPRLREAVLLHEDRYFRLHPGVNPVALVRAAARYAVGKRGGGASTLTMQLARIKYGLNTRTLSGKLLQAALALRFEAHYSKDELLEAYLNLAPYGYNIAGAGAAGFIYFHERPRDLTLPEALTLAVLPQSPARRRPVGGQPSRPALDTARNRLFARWLGAHPEDTEQKTFFALSLAAYGIRDLPFEAPHLTRDLLAHADDGQITASIDLPTQQLLERILVRYVRDRRDLGFENASALLVDKRTMEARALIGAADFHNVAIAGQVDGTRARRSPGSALKPFIYALALEQGLIHPASILGDAPVSFGSYTPDNFERDFRGPVTAHDALRLSRNIPAIKLAAQLRDPDLYGFLQKAGIGGLKDNKSYGLSVVLGGAEVTMRELAALYAMLANDGVMRPLSLRANTRPPQGVRLLTPEASFVALDMLGDTPKPYASREPLHVYWKTGTSNGFRDAWTAGVFGHYALVVWLGNFNGRGNPALIGVRAAAPLFFSMFDAIDGREPQEELVAGKTAHLHVSRVEVCATTGDLSLEDCPARASTWYIPGVSPIARQDIYRRMLVNASTGRRACRAGDDTALHTFEVWPSDLSQTMRRAGIDQLPLPAFEDGCAAADSPGEGQKPVILSPQPGMEYHARIDDSAEAVTFTASADGDAQALNWFIDNIYLGRSVPGGVLFWKPQPGVHQVRVIDDRGRSAGAAMNVSVVQ
jgi:penicillin-binding protein 1C